MSGARHRARVIALQALYEIDVVGHATEAALPHCIGEGTSEDIASFAQQLVTTILQHCSDIDERIQYFAPAYPVGQLSPVDRSILRLAISEIMFSRDIPIKIAINEAVELAKAFGSEASPRFVNGVLGAAVSAGSTALGSCGNSDMTQIKRERR